MLYQIHRLFTWLMVIATPVRLASTLPVMLPVPAHATASAIVVQEPYKLKLDTSNPVAITVEAAAKPNFDTEVIQPLQAQQAAEAAQKVAKARAAAIAAQAKKTVTASVSGDAFAQIRFCEAGGDYTRNSGNGYFGAYQYNLGTWSNYGGYARPDLAPASVQDEKAHLDVARRGWSPWPACARKAGLL